MTGQTIALALQDLLEPALRLDLVDQALGEGCVRRRRNVGAGDDRQFGGEELEDIGTAGRNVEFVGEVVHLVGDDILAGGVAAHHVAVTAHRDVGIAVGTVEDHQDGLVVLDPGIDIAVAVLAERGILDQLAVADGLGGLAPLQEFLHIIIGLVLFGGTAVARKDAAGVAREAARHIDADRAVTLLLGRLEEKLGTVIDLRDAAGRQQEGDALLVAVQALVLNAGETAEVVVVQEDQDVIRIGVEPIVRQGNVDVEEASRGAVGGVVRIREGVRGEEDQVEVHHGLQVGVPFLVQDGTLLPPGREAGTDRIPGLAGDVEVRIFLHRFLAPAGAEEGVHIRMGILADTVDAGVLDPPDTVLDQVVGDQRIVLVQVGHTAVEPAVGEEFALGRSRVRIDRRPLVVAGADEGVVEIEPVAGRQVAHPPVAAAAVVEDHVHDDLHAAGVGLVNEVDVLLHGAEARIDVIVVRDGVAVVGAGVVLLDRVEPDGRHAQVVDVVEMVHDTLDVTAVTAAGAAAVGAGAFDGVVVRVAICETVRGDEVQDVIGGETLGAGFRAAGLQFERLDRPAVLAVEDNVDLAGPGSRRDVEIQENVVRVLGLDNVLDGDAGIRDGDLVLGDVRTVEENLQSGILHADPPEGRVHVLDISTVANRSQAHGEAQERDGHEDGFSHVAAFML